MTTNKLPPLTPKVPILHVGSWSPELRGNPKKHLDYHDNPIKYIIAIAINHSMTQRLTEAWNTLRVTLVAPTGTEFKRLPKSNHPSQTTV